ncbi:MAG: Rieske 2Fe-2S domain-containing protein [Actinomycetota bacterium]
MSSRHARGSPAAGLVMSWRQQPIAIRLLRAFLGVTFVYAGVQKLADPHFLAGGGPTFIGEQLRGFARGSPIGGVLRALAHAPVATGLAVAFAETAVGSATLLGVAKKSAAAAGFVISMALFLSATWHVRPYFLGSDSMYAVAWAAYGVSGWETERRAAVIESPRPSRPSRPSPDELSRRRFIRGGVVVASSLLLGALAKAVSRGAGSSAAVGQGIRTPTSPRTPAPSRPAPSTSSAPAGTQIVALDKLQVGSPIAFQGPAGQPCALFRLSQNDVVAFSRICTHAGCEVGYDPGSRLLVCPCHGAEFDPARGAAPVAGPAPVPLRRINVTIDTTTGEVVLPA